MILLKIQQEKKPSASLLERRKIMAGKIQKYKIIDDNIFDELTKKHPIKSEKGVCYEQTMDYITVEVNEFDNNPIFRKLVKENSKTMIVYLYLRKRMCQTSWYIKWDNITKDDIAECLTLWGVLKEECLPIIDTLIKEKVIRTFHYDDSEYLTDIQQIYNWEMLQARRSRDRKSKQNNAKKKSITENDVQQFEDFERDAYYQQLAREYDDGEDFTNELNF